MNWYKSKKSAQTNYEKFLDDNRGPLWEQISTLGNILGLSKKQLEYLLQSKGGNEQSVVDSLKEFIKSKIGPGSMRFPQNNELRIAK